MFKQISHGMWVKFSLRISLFFFLFFLSRVYLACDVWFQIRDQTIVLKNIFIKREERQGAIWRTRVKQFLYVFMNWFCTGEKFEASRSCGTPCTCYYTRFSTTKANCNRYPRMTCDMNICRYILVINVNISTTRLSLSKVILQDINANINTAVYH